MNFIQTCEVICAKAKIAADLDIILNLLFFENITLNNIIKKAYSQKIKYITTQKTLNSYKLKTRFILNNSYSYISSSISSLNDEGTQTVLELDNNDFKRYFM
ncbi:hypothetical protein CDIK_3490 [Cucumispora dikerogammari]|nr:hypothetical protein CDIK_3490 [Cucumispora dikerogammari]